MHAKTQPLTRILQRCGAVVGPLYGTRGYSAGQFLAVHEPQPR